VSLECTCLPPTLTILAHKDHTPHKFSVIELLDGTLRLLRRLILHEAATLGTSVGSVQDIGMQDLAR